MKKLKLKHFNHETQTEHEVAWNKRHERWDWTEVHPNMDFRPEGSQEGWTALRVRKFLPPVPVRLAKDRVEECQVHGRSLQFAQLVLPDGGSVEVAWKTLAHVLNSESAVLL